MLIRMIMAVALLLTVAAAVSAQGPAANTLGLTLSDSPSWTDTSEQAGWTSSPMSTYTVHVYVGELDRGDLKQLDFYLGRGLHQAVFSSASSVSGAQFTVEPDASFPDILHVSLILDGSCLSSSGPTEIIALTFLQEYPQWEQIYLAERPIIGGGSEPNAYQDCAEEQRDLQISAFEVVEINNPHTPTWRSSFGRVKATY